MSISRVKGLKKHLIKLTLLFWSLAIIIGSFIIADYDSVLFVFMETWSLLTTECFLLQMKSL